MRIAYVTGGFPFPLTSGYLRHYYLLRELAQRHEISLLSIVPPGFDPADVTGVEPFVERVLTFRSRPRSLGRQGIAALAGLVPVPAGGSPVELARAAALLHAERPFDAAFFSGKATALGLSRFPAVPLVVDLCDASSSRVRGAMRYAGRRRRALLALRYRQITAVERRLIAEAARIVVAASRDRDELLATHGHSAVAAAAIVPNGVDLAFWSRRSEILGRDTVAFTGAMDYAPNVDAALQLVREVMPRVWMTLPQARLLVVGRDPKPEVRILAEDPRVTVTGTVEDVRPFLERAGVFAAPLRFGAGIQNKVLEALAMEVPVVVSSLAADGLRVDGSALPLEVADGAEEMAAAIVRRLERAVSSPTPHRAGRDFVGRNFDWARSAELVERLLSDSAQAARPTRAGMVAGR